MKNTITRAFAQAIFAASFLVFCLLIASCGGSSDPGSKSVSGSGATTATATISCQGKNCPSLRTASSTDTTQGGGIRRYSFVATVDSSMAPGTQFQIDVTVAEAAAH
jgi:hypothetical protein